MDENNNNNENIDPELIEEGWFNEDGSIGDHGLAFLATQDFS